ncbi:MAG: phosphatase PAP2 family protein [Eubacteriales bacterium]|nr:phosphatase PAP2 family protein [Eubacteriales bacterium]
MALGYLFPLFIFYFVILAIITGILRIMVGVHYPIDVLMGLFIGFVFGYLGFFILF